jgi:hypothetical protein
MIIYNVTINVDGEVKDRWLQWMRDIHMPEMLATGKFVNARMCRILTTEEGEGATYAVQFLCPSRELLERYYEDDAPRLRSETLRHFSDSLVAFRTELEVVDEQTAGI